MSTNRTDAIQISRRYATAIFALALETKKQQVVVGDMAVIAGAISGNEALAGALANPLVSHTQKAGVLAALMAKADPLTQRAIASIAKGGRAGLIPMIAEQLREQLSAHEDELEATITSARALGTATQKQLVQSLAKATGKTIKLQLREDAAVLGGLRIELGSLRLDATLSGALNNMREQLLAPTH